MTETDRFEKTIFYLFGYPGIGKKTIAEAMMAHSNLIMIDNHRISNLLRDIAGDEAKDLLEPIKETGMALSRTILDFIAEHCEDRAYVLTSVLYENDPDRKTWFDSFIEWSDKNGWRLIPVRLLCDWPEMKKRLKDERRSGLHKLMDAEIAEKIIARYDLLNPDHPNTIEVDVTDKSPEAAAQTIFKRAQ